MKSDLSNEPMVRGASLRAPGLSLRVSGFSLVAAVLALVLFVSCGSPPADQQQSDPEQPMLTILQSSVSIGDPHIASDSSSRLSMLFPSTKPW